VPQSLVSLVSLELHGEELKRFGIKFALFYFGGVNSFMGQRTTQGRQKKMLSPETAADAILYAAFI